MLGGSGGMLPRKNMKKNGAIWCNLGVSKYAIDVASDVGVNLCNVKSSLNTLNNEIFTDKRGDLPCVNISKRTCPVVK